MWAKNTKVLTKTALLLLLSTIGARLLSLSTSTSSIKQETSAQSMHKKTISLENDQMDQTTFSNDGGMNVIRIWNRAYWIDPSQPLDKRLMVCQAPDGQPDFSTRRPVDVSKLNDDQVGLMMKYVLDPLYEAEKEN